MCKRSFILLSNITLLGALAFMQTSCSAPPSTATSSVQLIKAGRLLDVKTGTYLTNQGVLVENERIKAIGPFAEMEKSAPKNARVINLGNATVLPGLIDCHTHLLDIRIGNLEFYENNALRLTQVSPEERAALGTNNAREVLEAGFTTVRDMGDATEKSDVMLRDAINAGRITGPRMLVATKKLTPPNGQHLHQAAAIDKEIIQHEYLLVTNAEDARRGVREAINLGADFIKVIVDDKPLALNLEQVKAIVDEAHRAGLKVAAHAHTEESTKVAVEAGADSIEHAYKISDESLRMMHDKNILLVATDFTQEAVAELLSKTLPPGAEQREEREQYVKEQVEYAPERLPRALKAGVRIAAGSDLAWKWPGRTRGQQGILIFDAYKRAGISAIEMIRAATMNAAELLGWQDRVGTIEANKFADIIAVAGDPLNDITELQRVKFVMKGGAVIRNEMK
ncbi:MAG: amidohydrolase family protein [Pyrinomonadaceae bacterium]